MVEYADSIPESEFADMRNELNYRTRNVHVCRRSFSFRYIIQNYKLPPSFSKLCSWRITFGISFR